MSKYMAYAIGAALVDTEIKVTDEELAQMNIDKGMMTLVDEARRPNLHVLQGGRAQLGYIMPLTPRLLLELQAGVWFMTDNDDFLGLRR